MTDTLSRQLRSMSAGVLLFTLALAPSMAWADGKGAEVRLRTSLAGGALNGKTPSGQADFRSEAAKNRSRLNVEVEKVAVDDGTSLDVFVVHAGASVKAGSIVVKLGHGELELNTQDGETVPAAVAGDMVVVNNGATPVLSGVLNAK